MYTPKDNNTRDSAHASLIPEAITRDNSLMDIDPWRPWSVDLEVLSLRMLVVEKLLLAFSPGLVWRQGCRPLCCASVIQADSRRLGPSFGHGQIRAAHTPWGCVLEVVEGGECLLGWAPGLFHPGTLEVQGHENQPPVKSPNL